MKGGLAVAITGVGAAAIEDPVASLVTALQAATATLAVTALTMTDRSSWLTSTTYALGDVVTQAGQRYLCRTAHTSGTFATDLAASKWVSLDAVSSVAGGDLTGTLPSPTVAKVNGISVSGTPSTGDVLTAASSTAATWQAASGGGGGAAALLDRGAWVTGTVYAVGDVVTQGGQRYACRTAHTGGTFATDLAASKWVALDTVTAAASDLSNVTPATGRTALGLGTLATTSPTGTPSSGTFLRGDGAWGVPGALPGFFDIRDYGAKVDGRNVYDAAMSSGQNVLTSATASFTSADVGKTAVVRGIGSAGIELVATISSVTNSTTAVLSGNSSFTVTGFLATIATDDTAAVRAALTACVAAAGGTIYHPGGICLLTGAAQTGTVSAASYSYAGVLTIPARPYTAGTAAIRFLGAQPPPQMFYGRYTSQVIQPETGCAVYQFTATSGNAVDCIPNATANVIGDYMSSWSVYFEDLVIRLPNKPQAGGVKLVATGGGSLRRCTIGLNASVSDMSVPTGTAVALTLPPGNNNGLSETSAVNIWGFPTGIIHNEHTILDNTYITYCLTGIAPTVHAHLSHWRHVYLAQYTTGVKPSGTVPLGAAYLSLEPLSSFSGGYSMDVDDWNGYIKGTVKYQGHNGGFTGLMINGAPSADVARADQPGWGSSLHTAGNLNQSFSSAANSAGGGLPQADTTGHVWSSSTSNFGITSGFVVAAGGGYAMTQISNGTNPTVTAVLTTGSSAAVGVTLLGARSVGTQFDALVLASGNVQILKDGAQVAIGATTVAASTSYTLAVDYGVTSAGTITAKLNGTSVVTYALSGAEQTAYVGRAWIGMRIAATDTGSKFASISAQ